MDCKFIYGFLTLHRHHIPLGEGQGQNVGLRDLPYFDFVVARGIHVSQTGVVKLSQRLEEKIVSEFCL